MQQIWSIYIFCVPLPIMSYDVAAAYSVEIEDSKTTIYE